MTFDLETIQEMWEKDAKIDRDNLHDESLNIPSLHAKIFSNIQYDIFIKKESRTTEKEY